MKSRGSQLFGVAASVIAITTLAGTANARSRLVRVIGSDQGLSVTDVRGLAQDTAGFLWIATTGGLNRYDGRTLVRWAPAQLDRLVHDVAAGPSGAVFVSVYGDRVYRVTATGIATITGPDGGPVTRVTDIEVASDGSLWLIKGHDVWRRARDGAWSRIGAAVLSATPTRLQHGAGGVMFLGTTRGLWQLGPGEALRLADADHAVMAIAPDRRGRVHFLSFAGTVYTLGPGGVRKRYTKHTRGIALAVRNETLWVGYDSHLVALRDDGHADQIAHHAGGLMVDREGSLWVATYNGLRQYPEPDTVIWDTSDGMRKGHARYIASVRDRIYASAWNEPFRYIDTATGKLVDLDAGAQGTGHRFCADADGVLWLPSDSAIVAVERNHVVGRYETGRFAGGAGCQTAPAGGVWLGSKRGLYWIPPGGPPAYRGALPNTGVAVLHPFEDTSGTLWASHYETVCRVPASQARRGGDIPWTCHRVPGILHVRDWFELRDGSLWMATAQAGILTRKSGGWKPVPGSRKLVGQNVHALARGRTGGIWIAAVGDIVRVEPTAAGLRVRERLSRWNGLLSNGAGDMFEDARGSVWLAANTGVTRVPRSARGGARPPPPVTLVAARIQGKSVRLGETAALPYDGNHAELVFAGPTFRDPSLARFRVRIGDGKWSQPSPQPVFNFVDLPPGIHRVQVAASIDGKNWAVSRANFSFRVRRPWYMEIWAWALGACLLLGVLFALHRLRMAIRLRLERQRMRIAMDLHDEMGSALGSIGLLAELSADADLTSSQQRRVAGKIQSTATNLGGALTDIVWSLRDRAGDLGRLAAYLRARGQTFFPGDQPRLVTDFPERWPTTELSLPVRRALQLIAIEAMYNAAKHAHANNVVLGLRTHGKYWSLWVEDDGVGIAGSATPRPGGGVGLDSMRRRAAAIEAELRIEPGAGGCGTRIELVFLPHSDDVRVLRQPTPPLDQRSELP